MYASTCACKGIRSCNLCQPTKDHVLDEFQSYTTYIYCDSCRQAIRMNIYESNAQCPHHNDIGNDEIGFPLDGIYLVSDFITEDEENNLINSIDNDIWLSSQSGRLKQDFGIKINFKKQTIKTKYFTGMPTYSKTFIERLQTHRLLNDFQSVELCNLDYCSQRGSHIDPHIDDIWIWGERLITVNLLSNTILSLIPNDKDTKKIIYIPLPRRWMIVLYGDARYEYKHAIQRQHISERRIAITFRELTGKTETFSVENKDLYEKIIRIGKRFTGISVGRFEKIVNETNSMINDKMETDTLSLQEDQLKELFESTYQTKISSFEMINPSTYIINSDKKYLIKLFPHSLISLEQLQTILSSCQLNETILNTSINQSHIIIIDYDNNLSANKQMGHFLARWRLATRNILKSSLENSLNEQWFNQQYAMIINKKKNSYPFLLSNLFTCQQQITDQCEYGLLWTDNSQSSYLMDLASIFLNDMDNIKEIFNAYEEIVQLNDNEINLLDTFVRLQLILLINNNDIDDEKQLDLLEQLSSNIFFVRNLKTKTMPRVIGLMSGSSLDGLDIACVDFSSIGDYPSEKWTFNIVHAETMPYSSDWIKKLSTATELDARSYLLLHTSYGHYLGQRVKDFIAKYNLEINAIDLVASHGHTVFHEPWNSMTGQIGDGAAISAETGLLVVNDLRAMDVAYGGQGAPIVPIGEKYL
ncbi:unnamed protein product, partial [Adineta steineri]